jgi:hypothetical protein
MPPKREWNTTFSNINNVLNLSRQHELAKDLGMATHIKPNFEDSLFVLNAPMLENQDMSEPGFEYFDHTNRDLETRFEDPRVHNGTNLDTSMSCILQRVKIIRKIIHFLTKQDLDDQLYFEGTPILLQTGHFEQDEQTPSLSYLAPSDYKSMDPYLFQDCPTFPLTGEVIDWDDYPDDTSDVSEDWDEDGYLVHRVVGFAEWTENVFKDTEVPNTLKHTNIVDENPWCFQCSEAHWEHEFPCSDGGHQQVNNIGHVIEEVSRRSAQAEEEVSVVNLSKRRLNIAAAGSAQSRRDSTLGSC